MSIKNIALALSIGALAVTANPVMAADDDFVADQKQECRQVVETECEAGAYGQETNCKTKAEQVCKQKQSISKARGKVLAKVHIPEETSLDLMTSLVAAGVLTTGAGAYALKRKIR